MLIGEHAAGRRRPARAGLMLALAAAAGCLSGCTTTGPQGQRSLIIISAEQELAIGAGVDESVRQEYPVSRDAAATAYVQEIGTKLAAHAERKDVPFRFTLLEADLVNAFAAPGGYIYVTTGLLKQADNEAEVAGVLAHEIGHVVGRHSVRQLQAAYGVGLAADLVLGDRAVLQKVVGIATGLVMLRNSRENEHESDEFGLKYSHAAGYDPRGIVTFFQKLRAMEGAGGGGGAGVMTWLSTHPATDDRIAETNRLLAGYDLTSRPLVIGAERHRTATAGLRQ